MNRLGSRIAAAITLAAGVGFAALVGGVGGSSASHVLRRGHHAPVCASVQPSLTTLNSTGKLIKVSLSGATDPDGDALTYKIDSVTQDEMVIGPPGDDEPGRDDGVGRERRPAPRRARPARRWPCLRDLVHGHRRQGDSCEGSVSVTVPRKKGETAADSGQAFDSFTGDPVELIQPRVNGAAVR